MRKFTQREVVIFYICVAMAAVYCINILILRPADEKKAMIDQKIDLALRRLQEDKSIIEQKDIVEQKYRQLVDRFAQNNSDAAEGARMLTVVQVLAERVGVHVANIQTQRIVEKESYKQFTVQLAVDASWPSILDFLYQMQGEPYYFVIEELNLENSLEGKSSIRGQLTVNSLRFSPGF